MGTSAHDFSASSRHAAGRATMFTPISRCRKARAPVSHAICRRYFGFGLMSMPVKAGVNIGMHDAKEYRFRGVSVI